MRDRRNTATLSFSSTSSDTLLSEKQSLHSHLSSTPLPLVSSPSIKEHFQTRPPSTRRSTAKVVSTFVSLLVLWRLIVTLPIFQSDSLSTSTQTVLAGVDSLPDHPTALVVQDLSGQSKWTVAIPHNSPFPLTKSQYNDICLQAHHLPKTLTPSSRFDRITAWTGGAGYYTRDRTFLDVANAIGPDALSRAERPHADDNICKTSLTFSLDTSDASFGRSLLLLWMSYGLAKKEGRAFFIDDRGWPYGRYTAYFNAPPLPSCSPPPPHEILPCPHSARHLVVSAATAPWTFGPSFRREFTRAYRHGIERDKPIFDLLRTGYEALFHLVASDSIYAENRVSTFKANAALLPSPTNSRPRVIGLHIRRGDRHPFEYQFNHDYLPLDRYVNAANNLLGASPQSDQTTLIVASDDPDMLTSYDMVHATSEFDLQRAQERIQLATKEVLDRASRSSSRKEQQGRSDAVENNTGWEGGFYSALFLATGNNYDEIPDHVIRMREFVGRGYLMDLAVLSQTDGVVCAVSSATCRLLAVMMGWDALKHDRWVNVDDGRPWSWDGRTQS